MSFRINNICGRIDATDQWQNITLFSRTPKVEEDLTVSERATSGLLSTQHLICLIRVSEILINILKAGKYILYITK